MTSFSLIRGARRRAGLSQAGLAQALGMPQSTVARWESGAMTPSFDHVIGAIRACGLRLELRVTEADGELESLVRRYLAMSPAERLAQNSYLVNFIEGARVRMAAAGG